MWKLLHLMLIDWHFRSRRTIKRERDAYIFPENWCESICSAWVMTLCIETVVICVLQYMKDDLFHDYSSVLSEVSIEFFSGSMVGSHNGSLLPSMPTEHRPCCLRLSEMWGEWFSGGNGQVSFVKSDICTIV